MYARNIRSLTAAARALVEGRIRAFLLEHEYGDFKNGEQFADMLLDELEEIWGTGWASDRARKQIAGTVRGIYEFYRTRDTTPFGSSSPIKLRLGGADNTSINFIGELDHFYFSKFGGNTSEPLRRFFVERYFEDGAALFGRESTEEMQDFRNAAAEKFTNLTDRSIKAIIQTAVQRIRNWAHIGSLYQAGFELARIVATLDTRTTELCRELNGKLVRVGVAQAAIERLSQLEPGEFAAELYESEIGKAISREPVATINKFLEEDGKTISDQLVAMGRGFPPYHTNCRTRVEGYFAYLD